MLGFYSHTGWVWRSQHVQSVAQSSSKDVVLDPVHQVKGQSFPQVFSACSISNESNQPRTLTSVKSHTWPTDFTSASSGRRALPAPSAFRMHRTGLKRLRTLLSPLSCSDLCFTGLRKDGNVRFESQSPPSSSWGRKCWCLGVHDKGSHQINSPGENCQ